MYLLFVDTKLCKPTDCLCYQSQASGTIGLGCQRMPMALIYIAATVLYLLIGGEDRSYTGEWSHSKAYSSQSFWEFLHLQ
ncbi:hypothetical protein M431DRAFT_489596 [Trichoderma harzianum CBS 226.95]|uniref:Uncharacterized protein n=1 Tax=Trichoderma harzianum CBS 226.95 TaxID=983964 RepID=A0A2T4AV18_TRIHA|nr:hypothetical protein M431DRAFT_489596 [Trichoderma harzianum CBS 226.95]PTB60818.1 hypothetical protein M431DRAFT_489596 [Trichoderma harzianum CBS 226.95]